MESKNKFEKLQSRLESHDFIEEFKNKFADELNDLATDPKSSNLCDAGDGERVRGGEKIQGGVTVRGLLARIGQDYRLIPDEIDKLLEIFLE